MKQLKKTKISYLEKKTTTSMASIQNQNSNVNKMDIRGVKIQVLQDISKRLNEFNNAERVFYKGNSAIKLASIPFYIYQI